MIKRKRKLPENYKYANREYTLDCSCPWCGEQIKASKLLETSKHDFLKMYIHLHKQLKMGKTEPHLGDFDNVSIVQCPSCLEKVAICLDISFRLNGIEKMED